MKKCKKMTVFYIQTIRTYQIKKKILRNINQIFQNKIKLILKINLKMIFNINLLYNIVKNRKILKKEQKSSQKIITHNSLLKKIKEM